MPQSEIVKFGRKNLVVTFSPKFVYPATEDVQNSMYNNNGQYNAENSWKSPMELESFSGVKINISGSGTGASCNIEATKLNGVALRSRTLLGDFCSTISTSSENGGASDLLYTVIKYAPKEYSSYKGKPAFEIAKALDYNSCMKIGDSFQCEGKFKEANEKQRDAIRAAAMVVAAINSAPDGFLEAFKNDRNVLSMVNNQQYQQFYNLVYYLENNYPGMLIETYLDSSNTSNENAYVIYDVPMKTPKIDRVDAQGLTDVYSSKITIDKNKLYPVRVEIHTGKGVPMKGRAVGIAPGSYVKGVDKVFDFTADEWLYALHMCELVQQAALTMEYPRILYNAEQQRLVSIQVTQAKKISRVS